MSNDFDAPVEAATAAPGEKRSAAVRWELVDRNGEVHRSYPTEAEAVEAAGSGGFFMVRRVPS